MWPPASQSCLIHPEHIYHIPRAIPFHPSLSQHLLGDSPSTLIVITPGCPGRRLKTGGFPVPLQLTHQLDSGVAEFQLQQNQRKRAQVCFSMSGCVCSKGSLGGRGSLVHVDKISCTRSKNVKLDRCQIRLCCPSFASHLPPWGLPLFLS